MSALNENDHKSRLISFFYRLVEFRGASREQGGGSVHARALPAHSPSLCTLRPSKLHSAASRGLQPTATAALPNIQKASLLNSTIYSHWTKRWPLKAPYALICICCSHTLTFPFQVCIKLNATPICHLTLQTFKERGTQLLTVFLELSMRFLLSSRPVKLYDLHFGCMCSCLCSVLLLENRVPFLLFFTLSLSNGRCVLMSSTLLLFVF